MKQGPDLSHNNTVDLDQLAARSDFVIVKATEGATFADPAFGAWWRRLRELGKPRVAYHFARPGSGDADDEARWFARKVADAGWRPQDGLMLDFEDPDTKLDAAALWQWAAVWVRTVRGLLLGAGPVLFYTYPNYWTGRMGDPGRPIPETLLNWARYDTDGPAPTPRAYPSPPAVWQCTNGTSGKVYVRGLDWNEMTNSAFATLFGQKEDDMGQFEGFAGDGKTIFQGAVRQVLNEGTAFGQKSWAETEEATLAAVQALTNIVREAKGSLAGSIVDLRSALLGAITAQPGMSDEQAEAAADKLLAFAQEQGVELIRDAVVEAFRTHPLTPAA